MSNCAVVDLRTSQVINIIIADPDVDQPYPDTALVAIPDGMSVSTDCTYTEATGFVCPTSS